MRLANSVARALLWPLRRILDPRFADINRRIGSTRQSVHDESGLTRQELVERTRQLESSLASFASANTESMTYLGVQLRSFEHDLREMGARLADVESRVDPRLALERRVDELTSEETRETGAVDEPVARLLNFALSHEGFAARDRLWINHPITVLHTPEGVRLGNVNERIVEIPYAFRALGTVRVGARLLDVGSAESTVALSLASMGYNVVALDLHRYPFSHPRLTVVEAALESWEPEVRPFDAIVCISTIEHVGLGWYGDDPQGEGADRRALEQLRTWLASDGLLVLTVPYGEARTDEIERTYNEEALDALVEGWFVEDRTIAVQGEDRTWTIRDTATAGNGVAMLVLRPTERA